MSRSASSIGRVASARSLSASVTPDIRRAVSAQARMPSVLRSLVYAKPSRCSSSTRMPIPRSPRAMTLSIAPSLISTDPDWASRRNTSPAAMPSARSASNAWSTATSLVTRSLMRVGSLSGWRVARGSGLRASRHAGRVAGTRLSLRRSGPVGERAAPTPGQDPPARHPPACPRRRSLQLPANDDARDADRRLRVGDRRALANFATRPCGISKVISDHIDLAHELGALADECGAAQRFGERPIADAVALGDLECEVARDDVDLTAAHLLHEDAVFDRAEDLRGIRRAGSDHRRGHPADRQVAERLPTCIAAPRYPELRGVLAVGEVRAENAVLDEDRPLSRRPLVVHRRCAALVRIGAIVDDRDELARDLLADPPRVHRETLEVQVGFEPVSDRLVDERAASLAREDDGVRAGRCGPGPDVEHRPAP